MIVALQDVLAYIRSTVPLQTLVEQTTSHTRHVERTRALAQRHDVHDTYGRILLPEPTIPLLSLVPNFVLDHPIITLFYVIFEI